MPTVIDELIVAMNLDTVPFLRESKKADDVIKQTTKTVEQEAAKQEAIVTKTETNKAVTKGKTKRVIDADAKKIEESQAKREADREKQQERDAKEKERVEKRRDQEVGKSKQELGDKLKSVAMSVGGAFLGFESLKGAVGFLSTLNANTAALGRTAENLGLDPEVLQKWGNAAQLAGGDAKDAAAGFAALSREQTAAKLRGEAGPLTQLARNAGVYTLDSNGQQKPIDQLLPEIIDGLKARGYSRADAYNLASQAGATESLFNLLNDPNRNQYLATAQSNVFANATSVRRAQLLEAKRANVKQNVDQYGNSFLDTLTEHPVRSFVDPTVSPFVNAVGAAVSALGSQVFGNAATSYKATQAARVSGYANILDATEKKYGIPEGDLTRMAYVESRFNPAAVNKSSGATGIMQLLPKYFPNAGKDTNADIDTAGAELARLHKEFGDWNEAIAAYNDGSGNIHKVLNGTKQLPLETQRYLQAVATPGATTAAAGTAGASDNSTTVTTGNIIVNTQATNGKQTAQDFASTLTRKGWLTQANTGISP